MNTLNIWRNGKVVFNDLGELANFVRQHTGCSISFADGEVEQVVSEADGQISEADLVEQVAAKVLASLEATPHQPKAEKAPAPPKPKASDDEVDPRYVALLRKAKKNPRSAELTTATGRKLALTFGQGYVHAPTGWRITGRIHSVNGERFWDHSRGRTTESLGDCNAILPCFKAGCSATRDDRSQWCSEHRPMAYDATQQWVAAGKPAKGTPAWADFVGLT